MRSGPQVERGAAIDPRVAGLRDRVARFWGQAMPVLVDDGPPRTDFSTVHLPTEELSSSDEELTALLLHEWGHRTLAPASVAQGHYFALLARLEGIREAHEAVNIATDLIVDDWYLRHPEWGALYARAERARLMRVASELGARPARGEDPVHDLLLACYLELGGWDDLGLEPAVERDAVRAALSALLDAGATLDQRLRRFFAHAAAFFCARERAAVSLGSTRRAKGLGPCSPLLGRASPWLGCGWDAAELVRLIVSSGHAVPRALLAELCGREVALEVAARCRVLEALVRVEPQVRRVESALRSERREGATIWRVGDPLRELDPILTLERAGVLLPGVTTMRARHTRGIEDEPGVHSVCLVVDNSGSTAGDVIRSELDAAVALLEACRRLRCLASAVVFGNEVVARVEPGDSYDRIACLLASLEGQSGGTSLAPALREALRFRPRPGRTLATVIFTDSYVADVRNSLGPLTALRELGPVVLFCVEDRLDQELVDAIATLRRPPHLVVHRPGQPLVDQALEVLTPQGPRGDRS